MKRYEEAIDEGTRHIGRADPVMRRLIRTCPPVTSLRLQRNRFATLVHSILSQQISVHAARSIRTRLLDLSGGITPERIDRLHPARLRTIGVSGPKVDYMKDLARKVRSGEVPLSRIGRLTDDAVVETLVQVRGIGVWTAQMFLIFSLGRLDVFPHEDHAVRSAIRNLYGLDELPNQETAFRIAEPWRPYATIASWYCWRSHELNGRTGGGV
jgi:DNA-3-methyladenine glycosylase II